MTTYAESQNKAPFDWTEFLNRDYYTKEELLQALKLSESWVTCACGNQCNVIPRDQGIPKDPRLQALGYAFSERLNEMFQADSQGLGFRSDEALETLRKIEIRSAEIIKELTT